MIGALIAVVRARYRAVRVLHGLLLILFGVTAVAAAIDVLTRSASYKLALPAAVLGLLGVTYGVRGMAAWRRNGVLADGRLWMGRLVSEPGVGETRERPGA
jgi:prepilin signal peptidase PulO-like enzyme (type II secretory pathway)